MTLFENVKKFSDKRGLSLQKVAKLSGMGINSIYKWKDSAYTPSDTADCTGLYSTHSFSFSLAIFTAQIPGYFTAVVLNEKIGRKATITVYLLAGFISAFAMACSQTPTTILITGLLLSFFMNGTYAGVYAYTPEVFPTFLRATGMGAASAIGRIGAIAAPLIIGALYPHTGFMGVFGLCSVTLLIGATAILFLGPSTTNRSLEDISSSA